ncbi:MAG: hypothetical protein RL238_3003 [Actinomycetota bacterium]
MGHDLDMVSFVRDYVELRINYSIVRLLTEPNGSIEGHHWTLTPDSGGDILRRYIGRKVLATEFDATTHLRLTFEGEATIEAPLGDEHRTGPEALHFMPADERGRVHSASMHIW